MAFYQVQVCNIQCLRNLCLIFLNKQVTIYISLCSLYFVKMQMSTLTMRMFQLLERRSFETEITLQF